MKWIDFKKKIEAQGVNDETNITYIDTDMYRPTVEFNNDDSAHIE